jgi:hypothetical protein
MTLPERPARSRSVITERDCRLIASIADCRYLTVAQIQRLHFPSEQTATRRLRALTREGYVASFRVPGLSDRFVAVTEAGAKLVGEASGRDVRVPRKRPSDAYFLRHFCVLNDLRIAVERACEQSPMHLVRFIPEYEGEVSGDGLPRKQLQDSVKADGGVIGHTPDAVFAVEHQGTAALFFVEVDRGTETLSDGERGVLKMLRFYLHYLASEGYQRYAAMFGTPAFRAFRLLITTTSEARLANMRSLGGELVFEPAHAKRFIWLATQASITEQTIFGPVWRALEPTDERVYAIAPQSGEDHV